MSQTTASSRAPSVPGLPGVGAYEWRVAEDRAIWSAEVLAIFGVDAAPANEAEFMSLVLAADKTRVEAQASALLGEGESYSHEYRILRPDAGIRHIHDRGVVERAPDGSAISMRGVVIDVTQARAGDDRWRAAVEAAGVGLYDYDIARGETVWSPFLMRMLGIGGNGFGHGRQSALGFVHADDRNRVAAEMEAATRRIGRFEFGFRIRRTDGEVRWLIDRGETIGPIDPATGVAHRIVGALTDVTDRQAGEARLRAAHDRFRQLVEDSPFGVCTVDADFRLSLVSAGARRAFAGAGPLLGRDFAEVLRILWPEPFATETIGRFRHTLETGESHHAPAMIERRGDSEAIEGYDWKIDRLVLPDGRPGVVCHFYDLSDRIRAEAALRDGEARLQLTYDAADIGAWDWDLATGVVIWTDRLCALLGIAPGAPGSVELFFEHIHPDDRAATRVEVERAIATRTLFQAEFRVVRPDGAIRHMVGKGRVIEVRDGVPVRMIGVTYDATERRQAEQAVRRSEERLRMILDRSVAFIGVIDADGAVTEVNATALAAGGVERADVVGRKAWDTRWWSHDPAEARRLERAVAQALTGETVRYDADLRMAGDTRMTVDLLLSPVTDPDGAVRQLVASGYDITDRVRATEHGRMLIREINHRSKNILTLVQAVARQTARHSADDFLPRFERRLQALAAAQDLLVTGERDRVALAELARSQLGHFQDIIGTRIRLDGPAIDVGAPAARALGMALHELATNASKYGALSNATGAVDLTWDLAVETYDASRFSMTWRERGGPLAVRPDRHGFGTAVIDVMARSALDAAVELDYAPDGLVWRLACSEASLLRAADDRA